MPIIGIRGSSQERFKNERSSSVFTIKEIFDMLEECLDAPKRELTKWEQGFLESVHQQFTNKTWISDKQLEILENLYTELT